jgi:hypothetical protein
VLEVIVRRANLQTTGRIFNKQTQLLAYADDIDIVGRSLEAVRDAYLALETEAAKVGMKINNRQNTLLRLEIGPFSTLEKLWLLAIGILKSSPKNDVCLEIQRRIQT